MSTAEVAPDAGAQRVDLSTPPTSTEQPRNDHELQAMRQDHAQTGATNSLQAELTPAAPHPAEATKPEVAQAAGQHDAGTAQPTTQPAQAATQLEARTAPQTINLETGGAANFAQAQSLEVSGTHQVSQFEGNAHSLTEQTNLEQPNTKLADLSMDQRVHDLSADRTMTDAVQPLSVGVENLTADAKDQGAATQVSGTLVTPHDAEITAAQPIVPAATQLEAGTTQQTVNLETGGATNFAQMQPQEILGAHQISQVDGNAQALNARSLTEQTSLEQPNTKLADLSMDSNVRDLSADRTMTDAVQPLSVGVENLTADAKDQGAATQVSGTLVTPHDAEITAAQPIVPAATQLEAGTTQQTVNLETGGATNFAQMQPQEILGAHQISQVDGSAQGLNAHNLIDQTHVEQPNIQLADLSMDHQVRDLSADNRTMTDAVQPLNAGVEHLASVDAKAQAILAQENGVLITPHDKAAAQPTVAASEVKLEAGGALAPKGTTDTEVKLSDVPYDVRLNNTADALSAQHASLQLDAVSDSSNALKLQEQAKADASAKVVSISQADDSAHTFVAQLPTPTDNNTRAAAGLSLSADMKATVDDGKATTVNSSDASGYSIQFPDLPHGGWKPHVGQDPPILAPYTGEALDKVSTNTGDLLWDRAVSIAKPMINDGNNLPVHTAGGTYETECVSALVKVMHDAGLSIPTNIATTGQLESWLKSLEPMGVKQLPQSEGKATIPSDGATIAVATRDFKINDPIPHGHSALLGHNGEILNFYTGGLNHAPAGLNVESVDKLTRSEKDYKYGYAQVHLYHIPNTVLEKLMQAPAAGHEKGWTSLDKLSPAARKDAEAYGRPVKESAPPGYTPPPTKPHQPEVPPPTPPAAPKPPTPVEYGCVPTPHGNKIVAVPPLETICKDVAVAPRKGVEIAPGVWMSKEALCKEKEELLKEIRSGELCQHTPPTPPTPFPPTPPTPFPPTPPTPFPPTPPTPFPPTPPTPFPPTPPTPFPPTPPTPFPPTPPTPFPPTPPTPFPPTPPTPFPPTPPTPFPPTPPTPFPPTPPTPFPPTPPTPFPPTPPTPFPPTPPTPFPPTPPTPFPPTPPTPFPPTPPTPFPPTPPTPFPPTPPTPFPPTPPTPFPPTPPTPFPPTPPTPFPPTPPTPFPPTPPTPFPPTPPTPFPPTPFPPTPPAYGVPPTPPAYGVPPTPPAYGVPPAPREVAGGPGVSPGVPPGAGGPGFGYPSQAPGTPGVGYGGMPLVAGGPGGGFGFPSIAPGAPGAGFGFPPIVPGSPNRAENLVSMGVPPIVPGSPGAGFGIPPIVPGSPGGNGLNMSQIPGGPGGRFGIPPIIPGMPGAGGPIFPFNFGGLNGIPPIVPGSPEGSFGPSYGQYPDTSHSLIGAPKGMPPIVPGTPATHHAHPTPYYHPGVTTDWAGHEMHARPHHMHGPHIHPGAPEGIHQIHGGNSMDGSLLPGVDSGAGATSVMPMRSRKTGLKAQQKKLNSKSLAMSPIDSLFDFGSHHEQGEGEDSPFLALLACILPAAFLMLNPAPLAMISIAPPPIDPTKLLGAGAAGAVNSLQGAGAGAATGMVNVS